MLKIVLGVIAGFVAWSIVWVGSDQVMAMASPGWYGAHQDKAYLALVNGEVFAADSTIMAIRLAVSVIASLMSGYLAAVIAGENRRAPLILGLLLVLVGVAVQLSVWNVMPLWFHFAFLVLLGPMTVAGGKLKKSA